MLTEILCFRSELTEVPSFEFALRERAARLAEFRHPYYARVRKIERLSDEARTVALVSDCAPGERLVDILAASEQQRVVLDLDAALCLVRQLSQAMALLHQHAAVAHGAIGAERLIVRPQARLFIVEHVMGAALEQLRYSPEQYWSQLRIAVPGSSSVHFDEITDLTQLGVVVLELVLGRRLKEAEYPGAIDDVLASAQARAANGSTQPLPAALRDWIRRALQRDPNGSFTSLRDAASELDEFLADDPTYSADVSSLEQFLSRYHGDRQEILPRTVPVIHATEPAVEIVPEPAHDVQQTPSPAPNRTKWIAAAVAIALVMTGGVIAARRRFAPAAAPVTTGRITLNTNPPGAAIEVDGTTRGSSPLTLSLTTGSHTLVVRGSGGEPRAIALNVVAGSDVSQYIEMPKAAASVGELQVRSEPAGARVIVDGAAAGVAPLTLPGLSPGEHIVKLESDLGSVTQTVVVQAGITASLVVPMTTPQGAPVSGWISVTSPLEVQLYEQDRLLGTSGIDRIMLPTGKHQIDLVSEVLGYRETRTVQVSPGRVSPISITLPSGTLSVNAAPWATVTIDGQNAGDTPIANVPLTIGPHEVVFKNPQFTEQRRLVTVTTRGPARISVDMAKQ